MSLHRVREGLKEERTACINRIRGVLAEFGLVFNKSSKALRAELADANLKLSERKRVERAKGILMKTRGVGEDEAYQMLRRMAMDRGKRLGEIAQQLIDMADLLI